MAARRFNETDIDFDAIDGDLAKLAPPKLSLKDVLDRLRDRMVEQRAKGVTVAQMHEVLKARGIEIGEEVSRRSSTRASCLAVRPRSPWRMPRLRGKATTRSERHGAKRRARESAISLEER